METHSFVRADVYPVCVQAWWKPTTKRMSRSSRLSGNVPRPHALETMGARGRAGGRGERQGGRRKAGLLLALWHDCSLPWAFSTPRPSGAELTGMSAPGDGAGLLHSVACSTWVTSRVCSPCPPRVPTLGLTTGFCTASPLRCLPVTSLRSDWGMSSHLLDGKTEAW